MRSNNIILIVIIGLFIPAQVSSLECFCNVCGEDRSCSTIKHKDSTCYKSVTKEKGPDGTVGNVTTYGCLSGGDTLHFMQCQARSPMHHKPTFIKCCQNTDYCNEDIDDPTTEDDPRWAEETITYDYRVRILAISAFAIFLVVSIVVLIKLAQLVAKTSPDTMKSIKNLGQSDDSLFTEPQASSSLSTQSCPSEGSFPKHIMGLEPSLSYGSGVGDFQDLLRPRTLATTVSRGVCAHVGEGRFGRVIVGHYHGEDVAVKCFRMIDDDAWRREDFIFKWLNHENVVRQICSELIEVKGLTERWMFLEYCPHGSLCDFLDTQPIASTLQALKILSSIINGLNYLHENLNQSLDFRYKPSIAHRDLKSKNILMRTPDICCLADFGHSLIRLDEYKLDKGKYGELHVGTIRYMAPEILQWNEEIDYTHFSTYAKADLYQFGLIAWEVCNRTKLNEFLPADKHLLPFENVVPHDPSIPDMIKMVCEDNYRPDRKTSWEVDPIMRILSATMPECWRSNPTARMETLGVKKRLKDLLRR